MKKTAFFAAAFAGAALVAGTAQAADCKGQKYTGEYLALQNPSYVAITAEGLNNAVGSAIVGEVKPDRYNSHQGGYNLVIVPADPAGDCEDFMKKLNDTGLFRWVEPNWIMTISPRPRNDHGLVPYLPPKSPIP